MARSKRQESAVLTLFGFPVSVWVYLAADAQWGLI